MMFDAPKKSWNQIFTPSWSRCGIIRTIPIWWSWRFKSYNLLQHLRTWIDIHRYPIYFFPISTLHHRSFCRVEATITFTSSTPVGSGCDLKVGWILSASTSLVTKSLEVPRICSANRGVFFLCSKFLCNSFSVENCWFERDPLNIEMLSNNNKNLAWWPSKHWLMPGCTLKWHRATW